MARAGDVTITLRADARPALRALRDAADKITVAASTDPAERSAAYGRMYRRHLLGAAEFFTALRVARRRRDPRRLVDRWMERACRRRARRIYAPSGGDS